MILRVSSITPSNILTLGAQEPPLPNGEEGGGQSQLFWLSGQADSPNKNLVAPRDPERILSLRRIRGLGHNPHNASLVQNFCEKAIHYVFLSKKCEKSNIIFFLFCSIQWGCIEHVFLRNKRWFIRNTWFREINVCSTTSLPMAIQRG